MQNYIPNEDYSLMHVKIAFVRLVRNMCYTGSIVYRKAEKQRRVRVVPFNRDAELSHAKTVVANYIKEKKASWEELNLCYFSQN